MAIGNLKHCQNGYNFFMPNANKLKKIRLEAELSQKEASNLIHVPFRTYCRYENEPAYAFSLKYEAIVKRLEDLTRVDETHGVLSLRAIEDAVNTVFVNRNIKACFLFGPYALKRPTPKSQVNLLVCGAPSGSRYFDMISRLEDLLHKKVDLIRLEAAKENLALLEKVFIEGVKIYG